MCKNKTVVAIVMTLVMCSILSASSANKVNLYLNGAFAFPFSPEMFSDYWKPGFVNFGGGIGFNINPSISTNVYFEWCKFDLDAEKFVGDLGFYEDITITGLNANIMTVTGNLKASLPTGVVSPYVWSGAGLFILSFDAGTISVDGFELDFPSLSENAIGINGGVGIDFTVAPMADIFVDGRFVLGFTEGETTAMLPVRLGIKIKF